jgi:hypothetical protein
MQGREVDFTSDIGKIVMPALKFLPPVGSATTERDFKFETDTAIYRGTIDLSWNPAERRVLDYKSTTKFDYLKPPDKLKKDPQSVLYAVCAAAEVAEEGGDPEQTEIHLNWVYMIRNPKQPQARKVQLVVLPDRAPKPQRDKYVRESTFGVMTHSELVANFRKIEEVGQEMLDHHREGRKGADLPFNLKGCNMYGGCPYRGDTCQLTPQQVLRSAMTTDAVKQKLAELKAKRAQQDASAGGGSATTPTPEAQAADKAEAAAQTLNLATLPAVNPPESSLGGISATLRAQLAATVASGLNYGSAEATAKAAVAVADEILKLTH